MDIRIFFIILCIGLLNGSICTKNIEAHIADNIQFEQPEFVVISNESTIGSGTTIGCGVHVLGNSQIGTNSSIGHFSIIKNCTIGNNVKIHSHCVLDNVTVEDSAEVGPFAHVKEQSVIKQKAVIGNFVEVTRSVVGEGSKAKHLSYLGDAKLGKRVNIGAGTITCNYNGVSKKITEIGNGALIGSDNCLVAPIKIGKNTMTGAGSVLTNDIPDNALAIGRSPQVNKEEYAPKLLEKYREEKNANENQPSE